MSLMSVAGTAEMQLKTDVVKKSGINLWRRFTAQERFWADGKLRTAVACSYSQVWLMFGCGVTSVGY